MSNVVLRATHRRPSAVSLVAQEFGGRVTSKRHQLIHCVWLLYPAKGPCGLGSSLDFRIVMRRGEKTANAERLEYFQGGVQAVARALQPYIHDRHERSFGSGDHNGFRRRHSHTNNLEPGLAQRLFHLTGNQIFVLDDKDTRGDAVMSHHRVGAWCP
jgi:hypothetical protein